MTTFDLTVELPKLLKSSKIIKILKLEDWNIGFHVRQIKPEEIEGLDEASVVSGACDYDLAYKIANIYISPVSVTTDKLLKQVLLHELIHLVIAPLDSTLNINSGALTENTKEAKKAVMHNRIALEQSVCQLEKIMIPLVWPKQPTTKPIQPKKEK